LRNNRCKSNRHNDKKTEKRMNAEHGEENVQNVQNMVKKI